MTSVFDRDEVFTTYNVELQLRDKLLGGTPRDPKIIEGWIRARAGVNEEAELTQMMYRTLSELGYEVTPDMTLEQLQQFEEASEKLAADKQTVGFKRDADEGLYIEGRQVKAMLKESVNILFAGDRWGKTKKGPKAFFAERVFVEPQNIPLGVKDPTGIEFRLIHTTSPQGPVHSFNYTEYVECVKLAFQLIVASDEVKAEEWPKIWIHAQENGLGAARSQSYGKFDVTKWEKVANLKAVPKEDENAA